MNDEMNTGRSGGDDFWGATPDWTDNPVRPRREKRSGDVTGKIKNLWSAAMTAGADATREHRVLDASAPRPAEDPAVGPHMFDDIDHEIVVADTDPAGSNHDNSAVDDARVVGGHFADADLTDVDRTDTDPSSVDVNDRAICFDDAFGDDAFGDDAFAVDPLIDPTTEVPVIEVLGDDALAALAPIEARDREDRRRRPGAIDPLLVRVGAVALATTLLVPLAIGLTSGDDDSDTLTTATTEVSVAPAVDETPDTDASTSDAGTPAGLDPASLPPAVPVVERDDAPTATIESSPAADVGSDEVAAEAASSKSDESTESAESGESAESRASSAGSGGTQDETVEADADPVDEVVEEVVEQVDEPAVADDGAARVDNCAIDYTVVDGDFWLRLADAAGVPLAELLEANGATVDTPLYPGDEICLPAGSSTPAPPAATTTAAPTTTDAPTTTTAPTTTEAPTTTTAPTTTEAPTTTVAPVDNSDASEEEVKQIIRDVWPDHLEDRALVIAQRESNFVPTAKNFCCYGLFQIYWEVHRSWLADIGVTNDQQLYDPATNARAAYALYERSGGWGPWSQTDY